MLCLCELLNKRGDTTFTQFQVMFYSAYQGEGKNVDCYTKFRCCNFRSWEAKPQHVEKFVWNVLINHVRLEWPIVRRNCFQGFRVYQNMVR